jgi:hypothetical protein
MKLFRFTLLLFALALPQIGFADDLLPSWNDTAAKAAIVKFVNRVTTEGSADFVPPADRIAVFDNDGALWSELHHDDAERDFAYDRKSAFGKARGWTIISMKNDWRAVW